MFGKDAKTYTTICNPADRQPSFVTFEFWRYRTDGPLIQLIRLLMPWGMRKAMQLEQAKDERMAENASLKAQVAALRAKNEELEAKIVDTQKREEDHMAQREKEHADETAFLKRQTTQLKAQLEQLLTAK